MAKVKINKLPEGYEVKDGKIVKSMAHGGMTGQRTGDQQGYGLKTFTSDPGSSVDSSNVRYSLSSVPRDMANIEAEGGETVLTDLEQNGTFGLYNIKGPRHSSGGVPMYLPDQSFIFSDTKDMKMKGSELAEFGIETRKSKTPASISKNFPLNQYYSKIDDEFADLIQVNSAEMMIEKNGQGLSKLAFAQELKKDFDEGVPTTAYPYLNSIGIDPIEFTAKVQQMSEEKARQEAISQLPIEDQQKLMLMEQLMAQQQMPQQQMPPEMMQQGMSPDMMGAMMPSDIPMAQDGALLKTDGPIGEQFIRQRGGMAQGGTEVLDGKEVLVPLDDPNAPLYEIIVNGKIVTIDEWNNMKDSISPNDNILININSNDNTTKDEQAILDQLNSDLESIEQRFQPKPIVDNAPINLPTVEDDDIPQATTVPLDDTGDDSANNTSTPPPPSSNTPTARPDLERQSQFIIGDDEYQNIPGLQRRKLSDDYTNLYLEDDKLMDKIQNDPDFKDVWINNIDPRIKEEMDLKSLDELLNSPEKTLEYQKLWNKYNPDNQINPDSKVGEQTLSTLVTQPEDPIEYTTEEITEEVPELEVPDIATTYNPPVAEFYPQDMLSMLATRRDRRLGVPFQPAVEDVRMDYVLEDPTRAIAALNEQANIFGDSLASFAGPQATSARISGVQGKNAAKLADTIAGVNQRNVKTINNANQFNTRFEAATEREQRDRRVKEYDDYERALEQYNNERMFDRDQGLLALSNALTNRAYTYNLNQLQPYYNVDPSSGGMINMTNTRGALDLNPSRANKFSNQDYYNRMNDLQKRFPNANTGDVIKMYDQMYGDNTNTNPYIPGYPPGIARKGKQVKRPIIPFYSGKMGV